MRRGRTVMWAAFAACCVCLLGCDREEEDPSPDAPASVLPGVAWGTDGTAERVPPEAWADFAGQIANSLDGVALHRTDGALVLAIEHRRFEPIVLSPGPARRLTGRSALDGPATIVLGSGFVSEFQSLLPLGLLQIDGEIRSPVSRHGYTRILGVGDGRLTVLARREYHRGLLESAMQVGPGVVENGALDISPRERNLPAYFRAFAATCTARDLAGITTRPMHLFDLGNELLALFASAGFDCPEVANLSGDREALLGLRAGGQAFLAGHPDSAKAALVAFRERAATGA
ncbi:MAG: hypothetical protein F4X36_09955 [Gammaproteobacteria bacterium]|nr:hypothetical protein [Gammaproteobacteria bacterium]